MKIKDIKLIGFLPFLGLLIVIVFFQIATGGRFLRPGNFPVFINNAFAIIVASCGMSFLMAQGNLDFSMAGNVCVSAVFTAFASRISIPFAIITAICSGSLLGCVNGFAHIVLGLPAFIATLATSFIFMGIANTLLGGGSIPADYAMKTLDNLPLKLSVLIAICIITFLVLEYSPFGKQCKAIGSREEVARQGGVNIKVKKWLPFIVSGLSCGLVAVFSILRTCTASTMTGANTQMNAMLALLLGGLPFSGGWASRFRCVIIGSLLMAVVANGLLVMGIDISAQQVIKGILFVAAVAISFDRKNATVIK
ncbi:MAG: ABC transporter permease [Spirochaetaceae bacterium]|jgi:ribose transport system permease protein|nr:ABC transporter permease [Spirochaetaceae bacterium]